jgi:hypothetical protein
MIAKMRRDFAALSPIKQAAVVAITAWNLWLIVLSQRSLSHMPAERIRGPKLLWRLACLTNSAGPLAYFSWGRR